MPKTATYQKAHCRCMHDRYCGWFCSLVGCGDYFWTFFLNRQQFALGVVDSDTRH